MKTRYVGIGTLLYAASVCVVSQTSARQQSFFEEGNQLYLSGDFSGALDRYQQIVDQGYGSAPLYYNLGNTYFKLGNVGRSVLYYERALRLNPGHADVRANLEMARSLAADDIARLPTFWVVRAWRWWVGLLSPTWLAWTVAVFYVTTIVGLIASLLGRGGAVAVGRRVALIAASLFIVFGINLTAQRFSLGQPEEAIILSEEVLVQSAPSDDRSLQVFTIHSGTKVRVDQLSGDWAEIVLEDGKVGWVRRDAFEII